MKQKMLAYLQVFGNFQAQLLLTVIYLLFLTPYAFLLRLFRLVRLPQGDWQTPDDPRPQLERMRRMF